MRKVFLILLILFPLRYGFAQTNPIVNSFGAHYSFNGSGDIEGFGINATKRKHLNKTFDWYYGSSLTFHFGKDIFYDNISANFTEALLNESDPMKFYTFGVQGESGLTLNLLKNKFPIEISTGSIIRYQSTSHPTGYNFYYDPTRFRDPIYVIKEIDKNTLSLGYKVQLEIAIIKVRRSQMFFSSYFQNDTNGDLITGLGFVFKNLKY